MNPDYLWLVDAIQLVTLFVIGPVVSYGIAYAAWTGKPQKLDPQRYGDDRVLSVAFVSAGFLLLGLARWLDADVRTPQFFLQVTCALLSGLLLGVAGGCCFSVVLRLVGTKGDKTVR